MQHDHFIIQADAQKTFDAIFKGLRIDQNPERKDMFVDWIEQNENETMKKLNERFRQMRKS